VCPWGREVKEEVDSVGKEAQPEMMNHDPMGAGYLVAKAPHGVLEKKEDERNLASCHR